MSFSDVLHLLKDWLPFILVLIGIPTLLHKEKKGWKTIFKEHSDDKRKETADVVNEIIKPHLESTAETLKEIKATLDDLHDRMGSSENDMALMKRGLQAELRSRLRMCAIKYIERKEITVMEKAEFETIYNSYHELGSNGIMDGYYAEVMKLPVVIDKT